MADLETKALRAMLIKFPDLLEQVAKHQGRIVAACLRAIPTLLDAADERDRLKAERDEARAALAQAVSAVRCIGLPSAWAAEVAEWDAILTKAREA